MGIRLPIGIALIVTLPILVLCIPIVIVLVAPAALALLPPRHARENNKLNELVRFVEPPHAQHVPHRVPRDEAAVDGKNALRPLAEGYVGPREGPIVAVDVRQHYLPRRVSGRDDCVAYGLSVTASSRHGGCCSPVDSSTAAGGR